MDERQLRTFLLVAESGSFSSSEDKAFVSKQAILKQMNSLEEELGFKLFVRKHNGITLTSQGEIFYNGVIELLDLKQKLIDKCLQEEESQYIRIGSTDHQVLLDPVNEEFRKLYPNIELRRIVNPNHSGEWRVENDIQDVAEAYDQVLTVIKDVKFIPLVRRYYSVVLDVNHPLAKKKKITLDEMKEYSTILIPLMTKETPLKKIRNAYKNTHNLLETDDVDHQIDLLYECVGSKKLFITANPFAEYIDQVKVIPINKSWYVDCGLIYKPPLNNMIRKYIDVAKKVYRTK